MSGSWPHIWSATHGWGLLSQFPPFRYFPIFSALSNHTLAIKYHVYIWQVSPQLSCGDTCQIWMWFEESNMCFCQVENFAYEKINERSFSNPHPTSVRAKKGTPKQVFSPFLAQWDILKKLVKEWCEMKCELTVPAIYEDFGFRNRYLVHVYVITSHSIL